MRQHTITQPNDDKDPWRHMLKIRSPWFKRISYSRRYILMCSSPAYKIQMLDFERLKDRHKQQHWNRACRPVANVRATIPTPAHTHPPENREPADRIYGHSISKRAVDLAERQGIRTVVSTMALHYFLSMGACDIDLHLTHWDPGKISSNWELMFNFNVWLKIPYIFIVNSDEIISKHPSWQRSGANDATYHYSNQWWQRSVEPYGKNQITLI